VTQGPVLILANEKDFAADTVIRRLRGRGVPVVRWNAETLAETAPLWQPTRAQAGGPSYRSVWLRQYVTEPPVTAGVEAFDDALVVRAQWRDWVATIDADAAPWMNPLWAARRAENKVVQLREATSLGLRLPATVVTNDPDHARAFRDEQAGKAAVVKSLAAGYYAFSDRSFMFTTALTDDVLSTPGWRAQPLIVQQRIARTRDIRALVVDGHLVAAARNNTYLDSTDWRLTPRTRWQQIALPTDVHNGCVELTRALGLAYCAIDLVDDGDTLWFLEANQAGEFHFLDRPLELGVAGRIANFLACEKHAADQVERAQ
jgi:hypothetical protein